MSLRQEAQWLSQLLGLDIKWAYVRGRLSRWTPKRHGRKL